MKISSSVLAIIGGGIVKGRSGGWRTTTFTDQGDAFGALGDYVRVAATAILAQQHPETVIIALGGKGQLRHIRSAPPVARVVKKELLALGVSARRITVETRSSSSYEQLCSLGGMVARRRLKDIKIISNMYHGPRLKAMLRYDSKLRTLFRLCRVRLVAAERVLVNADRRRWLPIITRAYASPALRARVAAEKTGARAFKTGHYKHYESR